MAGDDDLKAHALNSSHDFYDLLSVPESAQEPEIRRAYRKTALKYHPDKVGPSNTAALEKFHLLNIAYEVLSQPTSKELYDNARRARQAKAERDKAYEGRRKWMKEDLERRESGAFKRTREEADAEEEFERELRRLAEDGKRRRKEREEQMRKEMEEEQRRAGEGDGTTSAPVDASNSGKVADMDRSITLRFLQNEETVAIDKSELISRFSRFGGIEDAVLREKKLKVEGSKHRQPYTTAVLMYDSVVGAHAAVSDFPRISQTDEKFAVFEAVGWAAGKEPEYIPSIPTTSTPMATPRSTFKIDDLDNPVAQNREGEAADARKVPSFNSFKAVPAAKGSVQGTPSVDEITMMRLKIAERRRVEKKTRREDAEVAAVEAGGGDDGSAI